MLCKITTTGDQRSQEVQLLKGVREIATAAAGSTPSVICSTAYNNATTNPYDIITVLDNTTAGGWTLHAPGTNLDTDVEAGAGYQKFVQLYSTTNKSALPYAWVKLFTSTSGSAAQVPYSVMITMGLSSSVSSITTDGTSTFFGTANDNANAQIVHVNNTSANTQDYHNPLRFATTTTRVFYVSCNSEHIHIQQSTDSTQGYQSNGAFWHYGTRTNSTWEDAYDDNPYWVGLFGSQGQGNSNVGSQGYFTRMRLMNASTGAPFANSSVIKRSLVSDNAIIGPLYNNSNLTTDYAGHRVAPTAAPNNTTQNMYYPSSIGSMVSGYTSTSGTNTVITPGNTSYALITPVIFPAAQQSQIVTNGGLTSDPVTNALMLAAYPVMIQAQQGYNYGGYMKNLFQSNTLSSESELNLYHVVDTPTTINGENFFGIRHGYYQAVGNTARQLLYVKTS